MLPGPIWGGDLRWCAPSMGCIYLASHFPERVKLWGLEWLWTLNIGKLFFVGLKVFWLWISLKTLRGNNPCKVSIIILISISVNSTAQKREAIQLGRDKANFCNQRQPSSSFILLPIVPYIKIVLSVISLSLLAKLLYPNNSSGKFILTALPTKLVSQNENQEESSQLAL